MNPATLALILGPQLISGGMQYFQGQEANEYAQQKERELQEALNKIGIPEARPEYFTPEVYAYLENYNPEVAAYVRERDPRMVEMQSMEAKRARGAEQQALQSMLDRSREGTDVMAEIQRARGMREAAGTMASQAATLQQQLQRQGQQGGLAAYGAALQQQQGAGMQAALAGEQAALAGLQERGRATTEAGSLAGKQLGRELDIERGNVNAINAFNQRLAQSQQDQANLAANIRNQGALENIRGRQRIGEKNVASKASARDRQMDFNQQQYINELAKYRPTADLSKAGVDRRYGAAADTNRAIQGIGDLVSTGGYLSAGYTPKGYNPPAAQKFNVGPADQLPDSEYGPSYYQEDPRKRKTMEA
jgi:hypothetical protein